MSCFVLRLTELQLRRNTFCKLVEVTVTVKMILVVIVTVVIIEDDERSDSAGPCRVRARAR